MRAAIRTVRARNPGPVVVASPIAAAPACAELTTEVEEIVCVVAPRLYLSVALWYRDFSQVPDQEVERLLALSASGA
jgi:predicted phosphoribosyltransferase